MKANFGFLFLLCLIIFFFAIGLAEQAHVGWSPRTEVKLGLVADAAFLVLIYLAYLAGKKDVICLNCGHPRERHQHLGFMWVCWHGGANGCTCIQWRDS